MSKQIVRCRGLDLAVLLHTSLSRCQVECTFEPSLSLHFLTLRIPITTVSGILGHASTQMTLDVYGHLYEDDAMTYMDRLGEKLFAGTDKERTNVISVA